MSDTPKLTDREWELITWLLGMASTYVLQYMRFTEEEAKEIHKLYSDKFFSIDKLGENNPSSRLQEVPRIIVEELWINSVFDKIGDIETIIDSILNPEQSDTET